MKSELSFHSSIHPMVIFWLGLLTGAVIVGLTFFYRVLQPVDIESAVLRNNRSYSVPQIVPQVNSVNPNKNLNTIPTPGGNYGVIPTPGGNLNAIPTPGGN